MIRAVQKIFSPGRIHAVGNDCLRLILKNVARHVAIAGGTGMGKTKLLELIVRQAASQGIGVTYISPHPDACNSLIDWLTVNDIDPNRVVYLEPTADHCFTMDPFAGRPRGRSKKKQDRWLRRLASAIFSAYVRNVSKAEQEMMKRLKRWFKAACCLCGLDLGDGEYLGLGELPSFFDPGCPEFVRNMERVRPHTRSRMLRRCMRSFDKLADTPTPERQERWVESSINLTEDCFGPTMMDVVSRRGASLSQRDVILQSKIQIVNTAAGGGDLSTEEGDCLGGLVLSQLIESAKGIPEGERVLHIVIVDEFEHFIGEDIRTGFNELRKYELVFIVAYQDGSCLVKGDLDVGQRLTSQCGLRMTFQQQSWRDIEEMSKDFVYGHLNLTPLLVDTVFPDGYDWVPTESLSLTENSTWTVADAKSLSRTFSETRQKHTARAISEQVALALSSSESNGTSRTNIYGEADAYSITESVKLDVAKNHTESNAESTGTSNQQSTSKGQTKGTGEVRGSNESETLGRDFRPSALMSGDNHSKSLSSSNVETISSALGTTNNETTGVSDGTTVTKGISRSDGESHTDNESRAYGNSFVKTVGVTLNVGSGETFTAGGSRGASRGESTGETHTDSKGGGTSRGITTSLTPLQRVRIERLPSGRLVISVEDQIAAVINILASLPERMVLCKAQGMGSPFILRVHDVRDPYEEKGMFRSPAFREAMRKKYLERVYATHPFYFVPEDEEDDECRCAADCACVEVGENPFD